MYVSLVVPPLSSGMCRWAITRLGCVLLGERILGVLNVFFFLLDVLSAVSSCLSSVPFHFLTVRPLRFLKTGFSCVGLKISEVKKIIFLLLRKVKSFLFFAFHFVFF